MRAGNVIKHNLEKQVTCLRKRMRFSPFSHLLTALQAACLKTTWKIHQTVSKAVKSQCDLFFLYSLSSNHQSILQDNGAELF